MPPAWQIFISLNSGNFYSHHIPGSRNGLSLQPSLRQTYWIRDNQRRGWGGSGRAPQTRCLSLYIYISSKIYLELYYPRRVFCPWLIRNYVRNSWLARRTRDAIIPSLICSLSKSTPSPSWYQAQLKAMGTFWTVIYLNVQEKLMWTPKQI